MSEDRPFRSSTFKPDEPRKPKTVRRKTTRRATVGETGQTPAAPPPRKNPLALAFGIGGGVLLLLILVAVLFGGGSGPSRAAASPRPRPKPKAAAAVEDTRPARTRINTNEGAILFICAGDNKHPEREVLLDHCGCGAKSRFQWDYDASQYRCQGCKAVYAQAKIACPACGKVPRVHRIKYGA